MDVEIVELQGHIIDSLILPRVLDEIVEAGVDYAIAAFEIGKGHDDPSFARIELRAERGALDRLLVRLADLGATQPDTGDARLTPADADGVFSEDFYSTTNLPTQVRVDGAWIDVENPEMDCAIVVSDGRARTVAMSDAREGDKIVCGHEGIKVSPLERPRSGTGQVFSFMSSEVSSEKPQGLMVERIAEMARDVKARGLKLLWVLGPAVVHTGSVDAFCALVRSGWVDVVFAGNALATHDSEGAIFGTSLGVSLAEGIPTEHGHEHHIRSINLVRRAGSFKTAVDQGLLTSGIMYHLVKHNIDYVLGGSVRDDGPLPDVHANVIDAADAMRAALPGVGVALMLASTLHAIATGNLLPAGVETFCVDINQAVVTKLADRGSHQALGIVTDVGPFTRQLADRLCQ